MTNKIILTSILILSFIHRLEAQNELEINELFFRYEIIQDSIYCFIAAPTKGWLLIGFNDKNSTSKADFKFFSVKKGQAIAADYKNIEGRKYMDDSMLNGENNIHLVDGLENAEGTQFVFVIPLSSSDSNDFRHEIEKPFWLILAYSNEDDFQHHSRMRKHLPFQWKSK